MNKMEWKYESRRSALVVEVVWCMLGSDGLGWGYITELSGEENTKIEGILGGPLYI